MRHGRNINLNAEPLLAGAQLELQPHLAMLPPIDALERFLLRLFLRHYIT